MSDAKNPTTPTKTPSVAVSLTDNETKIITAVLRNLTNIEFDADAVAKELGMKDGVSVRSRWNTIKRTKLKASAAPAGGVDKSTPATKNVTPKNAAYDSDVAPKKRTRLSADEVATWVATIADITNDKKPTKEEEADE